MQHVAVFVTSSFLLNRDRADPNLESTLAEEKWALFVFVWLEMLSTQEDPHVECRLFVECDPRRSSGVLRWIRFLFKLCCVGRFLLSMAVCEIARGFERIRTNVCRRWIGRMTASGASNTMLQRLSSTQSIRVMSALFLR